MIAVLEVVRREVLERRLYLVGGLLAGLLPLVAPLLPQTAGQPPGEVRESAAVAIFWLASLACALLLGATVFGNDLAERRLGFYFSRPLPGWAIYAGKLGAALLLTAAASLLVLAPTLLVDRRLPGGGAVGSWLLTALTVLLVAHYLRTVALARSPWRLLDLAGVVLFFVVLRWLSDALVSSRAPEALARALAFILYPLPWALAVCVAAQILRGRTSVRRGHRLLAISFWSLTGASLAAASGYTAWVLSAGPEQLGALTSVQTPAVGEWTGVSGPARRRADYHPSFLYRPADGARIRLPATQPRFGLGGTALLFSGDGSTACWFAPVRGSGLSMLEAPLSGPAELVCADLGGPAPRPRSTAVVVPAAVAARPRGAAALSRDGRLLAVLGERLLTVEERRGGRLLASSRRPTQAPGAELFFSHAGDRLFLLALDCVPRCRLELWRLELSSGEWQRLLERDGGWGWSRDPLAERLLLIEDLPRDGVRLLLADLDSGVLRPVTPPSAAAAWVGEFLADGRLLLLRAGGEPVWWWVPPLPHAYGMEWVKTGELWLADRDAAPLRRLPLRPGGLRVGGQPAAGQLLLAYRRRSRAGPARRPGSRHPSGLETYLVDLESGRQRLVGADLTPVAGAAVGPASVGSRLLQRGAGGLLLLDPATLETRVVLGSG